ncbi:MAG: RluA family pseudouridine synthase [Pseudomonadales bacterium]
MGNIPETGIDDQWLAQIDTDLLVVNKPAGLSVLRDRSGQIDLWQRLTAQFGKLYLVHRIDKATSGLLLIARTQHMQSALTRAFAARQVDKLYLASVVGQLSLAGTGEIDLPLRKGRKNRYRIAAPRASITRVGDRWQTALGAADGLASSTRLRKLAGSASSSTLALMPRTGRSHQLRVHLAWIGHPIVGDHLYGRPNAPEQQSSRLMLHAARLRVPGIGAWSVPLP